MFLVSSLSSAKFQGSLLGNKTAVTETKTNVFERATRIADDCPHRFS